MIFKQWSQVIDGSKTQTRRHFKPGAAVQYLSAKGELDHIEPERYSPNMGVIVTTGKFREDGSFQIQKQINRPYLVKPKMYQPGILIKCYGSQHQYSCDVNLLSEKSYYEMYRDKYGAGWKKAMLKDGWQEARYTITKIRVQRLQDITPDDALAEGLIEVPFRVLDDLNPVEWNAGWYYNGDGEYMPHPYTSRDKALISGYRYLWQSINEKTKGLQWDDNPLIPVYHVKFCGVQS